MCYAFGKQSLVLLSNIGEIAGVISYQREDEANGNGALLRGENSAKDSVNG